MRIFHFEYAFLVSLLIGVSAIVPIVGAFIGTVPAVFLLFLVEPMQAVWFIVFIVILQQIEGHLIYPKVVGSSIGLPGMWVLAAVLIGGGLGGISGMLIGVPLAATLYKLLREMLGKKEEEMRVFRPRPQAEPTSAVAAPVSDLPREQTAEVDSVDPLDEAVTRSPDVPGAEGSEDSTPY